MWASVDGELTTCPSPPTEGERSRLDRSAKRIEPLGGPTRGGAGHQRMPRGRVRHKGGRASVCLTIILTHGETFAGLLRGGAAQKICGGWGTFPAYLFDGLHFTFRRVMASALTSYLAALASGNTVDPFGGADSGGVPSPVQRSNDGAHDPALIREYARLLPPSCPEDRFLSEHERQGSTPSEMLLDLVHMWGKDQGPTVLDESWRRGLLSRSDLRIVLAPIWCAPMRPEPLLGTANWVALFRAAGYRAPDGPIVAYRGATPPRKFGMSWTTDIDRAVWFAEHYQSLEQWSEVPQRTYVYRCTVEPAAVLCQVPTTIIGDLAWEEHEVIVDPSCLRIEGYYDLSED